VRRKPGLTELALPELQLAVGVGIVKDQEEDVHVCAVEQAGSDLGLIDLAGVGDADEVEIVDREGEVVADRGAIETGRGQISIAAKDQVPVVIGEEERVPAAAFDAPGRAQPRGLPIEMRPHGGL
jgi:hypothetical protein